MIRRLRALWHVPVALAGFVFLCGATVLALVAGVYYQSALMILLAVIPAWLAGALLIR